MNGTVGKTVWITGAGGRIGQQLCRLLAGQGFTVRGFSRASGSEETPCRPLPDNAGTLAGMIAGADALIHLAAPNPSRLGGAVAGRHRLAEQHLRLARLAGEAALLAGCPRLVHMSSARIYGIPRGPCREDETPSRPADSYGEAKLAAEDELTGLFADQRDRLTILRAPVVHGTGRRGAAGLAFDLLRLGLPLPRALLNARKSVLGVENLASCVAHLVLTPAGAGGVFNITDPGTVSFGTFAHLLGQGEGPAVQGARWLDPLLHAAGRMPLAGPAIRHLASDCVLETGRLEAGTGWTPPFTTAGLAAARGFG